MTGQPLDDLVVVELGRSRSVAFCGKFLALLGATVVKVEPPEGDPLRREGPYVGDAGVERSIPFLFLNTGKRSVRLSEDEARAKERTATLARSADVLLLDGGAVQPPVDVEELRGETPGLVVTRISPFGETGPCSSWQSTDIVQYAMSGWMHMNGLPEREPLSHAGGLASSLPGLAAATATLMAIHARGAIGRGQDVEVSQQEVLLLCTAYPTLAQSYTGVAATRAGAPFPMTIVPGAEDSWLGINVLTQNQWEALCSFAGLTDLLEEPRFAEPVDRRTHGAEITARFREWADSKDAEKVFTEGQVWRVPFGFVPEIESISSLSQHVERGFFQQVEHPGVGPLNYPRLPMVIETRSDVAPAPLLGEYDGSSFGSGPAFEVTPFREERADPGEARRGPMEDLRIVDLTMWWSGPLATGLFALMGAEVIKVESIQRVDGWRLTAGPSVHGVEGSHVFNGVNLNKQGITLDLSSDEGRAVLRSLVERADVLAENYSTRVMANLGVTDEVLLEWNPNLIIMSLPGFGQSGPWADYVGFAPTIEQISGLPRITGYEGGPPTLTGTALADPTAGLTGALALMAGSIDARRAARPTRIDVSQLEALTSLLGEALLEQQATGAPPPREGNRDRRFAPQGCYPCSGEDRWLVLSARDQRDWAALCGVIERPDLAEDSALATLAGRRDAHDRIDTAISSWANSLEATAAAARLQAGGVPAAAVLNHEELATHPHLSERGYFVPLERPGLGTHPHPGLPFNLSETPGKAFAASPTLGQHNASVLQDLLGLDAEEFARLSKLQVIGQKEL